MAASIGRKRPLPEERMQLVVPAELKARAMKQATKEKLPLQVFVRLALEAYMKHGGG